MIKGKGAAPVLNVSHIKEFARIYSENKVDTGSLLEIIWKYYTVYTPIDNTGISTEIAEIEPMMMQPSQKRKRRIKRLIGDLCETHERDAFIEGIRVGERLVMEILDEGETTQKRVGVG